MKRLSLSILLVAVAAVISVTVIGTAASGSNGRKSSRRVPVVQRAISPRLYRLIGALSRAKRASTSSPPLPVVVREGTTQQTGVSPAAAVFAGGAYPTWIIPGSTEVCLMHGTLDETNSTPGGICGTIAAFEQRGLAEVTESAPGSPMVIGLVPNGNASVEVTDLDGSVGSVPVTNNVYEITKGDPVSAKLRNAQGVTITRRLPVIGAPPPASAPAG